VLEDARGIVIWYRWSRFTRAIQTAGGRNSGGDRLAWRRGSLPPRQFKGAHIDPAVLLHTWRGPVGSGIAHGMAAGFIAQQPAHLARDGRRVGEWHQYAALLRQHSAAVPIRRRDHGFARANAYANVPEVIWFSSR